MGKAQALSVATTLAAAGIGVAPLLYQEYKVSQEKNKQKKTEKGMTNSAKHPPIRGLNKGYKQSTFRWKCCLE